jgi:hypothetical protein
LEETRICAGAGFNPSGDEHIAQAIAWHCQFGSFIEAHDD